MNFRSMFFGIELVPYAIGSGCFLGEELSNFAEADFMAFAARSVEIGATI